MTLRDTQILEAINVRFDKLNDKLDERDERLYGRINENTGRVIVCEQQIKTLVDNCGKVQDAKKPWRNAMISAIIGAAVSLSGTLAGIALLIKEKLLHP